MKTSENASPTRAVAVETAMHNDYTVCGQEA